MEPNGLRKANLTKIKPKRIKSTCLKPFLGRPLWLSLWSNSLADVPDLCIFSIASDNRFTMKNVKAGKTTIIAAALEAEGIIMLSYSADGDARELKMEQQDLELGKKPQKGIKFPPLPIKR
jgi:hypothetical protein